MKRLFVLTIKYIPIIQLIGMLINNSLYTYDINIEFDYIGDFPNLTEEQLDEKIIHSAINFWFEDEDAGSGKVWNYFKDI